MHFLPTTHLTGFTCHVLGHHESRNTKGHVQGDLECRHRLTASQKGENIDN